MGYTFSLPKKVFALCVMGSFTGGVVIFKKYNGALNYSKEGTLKGQTVIITGANTGIGKETAHECARRKARVIMACRDLKKCEKARKQIFEETGNQHVECKECDLASQVSIRNFAKEINESESHIKILVNNAGVMRCKRSVTKEGIELQLGTNHMGHFLLTTLLLDKLKASAPARIINVSSIVHQMGKMNFDDLNSEEVYDDAVAYNQSKLANMLFTKELSERLKGTGVTCNAIHPGMAYTELTRHITSFARSYTAAVFVHPFLWLMLKTSRQGAQTTMYAIMDNSLEGKTGLYLSNMAPAKAFPQANDSETAKRLWAVSEQWTSLS